MAVAKRYKSLGVSGGREATATFFLLLDLATFFDLFHAGKHDQALDTIDKIQQVPFTLAEIDYRVASFRMLCDEVGFLNSAVQRCYTLLLLFTVVR